LLEGINYATEDQGLVRLWLTAANAIEETLRNRHEELYIPNGQKLD
jgi:hypothetical protein